MEEWKIIQDFNHISVSNLGNVKNTETNRQIGYKKKCGNLTYIVIDVTKDSKKYTLKVHRLVALAFIPNPNNKEFVDHIDGNGQNNNIENLRWATNQENNRNQKLSKNNDLKVKGVQLRKDTGKYRARITINQKLINLGNFDTLDEAIKARKKASCDYFKEFQNNCERN